MSTLPKEQVRYSIGFKQLVVRELEEHGYSYSYIRNKYGVKGGATIQNWIRKFGKYHLLNKVIKIETMNEQDRLKQLEQENKKLKIALADAYMAKDSLQVVIDIANEHYRTDLKKSFGDKASGSSKTTTR